MKYAGIKESCILLIRSILSAEENTREITEHLFEEIIAIIREVIDNHETRKNIGIFRLILQLSRVLIKDDQFFDHVRSEGIYSKLIDAKRYLNLYDNDHCLMRTELHSFFATANKRNEY